MKEKKEPEIGCCPTCGDLHPGQKCAAADEVGFELGEVDHHGELELILDVGGRKGSSWLSEEMWKRMGEVAGWPTVTLDQAAVVRWLREVAAGDIEATPEVEELLGALLFEYGRQQSARLAKPPIPAVRAEVNRIADAAGDTEVERQIVRQAVRPLVTELYHLRIGATSALTEPEADAWALRTLPAPASFYYQKAIAAALLASNRREIPSEVRAPQPSASLEPGAPRWERAAQTLAQHGIDGPPAAPEATNDARDVDELRLKIELQDVIGATDAVIEHFDGLFLAGDFATARRLLDNLIPEGLPPRMLSGILMVTRAAKTELGEARVSFSERVRVALSKAWAHSPEQIEKFFQREEADAGGGTTLEKKVAELQVKAAEMHQTIATISRNAAKIATEAEQAKNDLVLLSAGVRRAAGLPEGGAADVLTRLMNQREATKAWEAMAKAQWAARRAFILEDADALNAASAQVIESTKALRALRIDLGDLAPDAPKE